MGDELLLEVAADAASLEARVDYIEETLEKMKEAIIHIEDLLRAVQIWSPPGSAPPGSATQTVTTSQSSAHYRLLPG